MAALTLPEEYQQGLITLAKLDDKPFDKLLNALETAGFALQHRTLSAKVSSQIETIPKQDIARIVEMLVSMNIVRRSANIEKSEFIDDVIEAIRESDNEELIFISAEWVENRLGRLLGAKSLEVVSKAQAVTIDHERRFCSSRIATDISPVFGDDAESGPMAAVITHALRISFHQDSNDLKEFFVEMDSDDLMELRDSIDRAEQKAESLKSVLDAAKLPYVE